MSDKKDEQIARGMISLCLLLIGIGAYFARFSGGVLGGVIFVFACMALNYRKKYLTNRPAPQTEREKYNQEEENKTTRMIENILTNMHLWAILAFAWFLSSAMLTGILKNEFDMRRGAKNTATLITTSVFVLGVVIYECCKKNNK